MRRSSHDYPLVRAPPTRGRVSVRRTLSRVDGSVETASCSSWSSGAKWEVGAQGVSRFQSLTGKRQELEWGPGPGSFSTQGFRRSVSDTVSEDPSPTTWGPVWVEGACRGPPPRNLDTKRRSRNRLQSVVSVIPESRPDRGPYHDEQTLLCSQSSSCAPRVLYTPSQMSCVSL